MIGAMTLSSIDNGHRSLLLTVSIPGLLVDRLKLDPRARLASDH